MIYASSQQKHEDPSRTPKNDAHVTSSRARTAGQRTPGSSFGLYGRWLPFREKAVSLHKAWCIMWSARAPYVSTLQRPCAQGEMWASRLSRA
eukprot:7383929-Prymnesium_polylepis.2